jgi:hypothetical protein
VSVRSGSEVEGEMGKRGSYSSSLCRSRGGRVLRLASCGLLRGRR